MENIFENWNESKNVLLEGLTPAKRKIVSRVLENQREVLLRESAPAGVTAAHSIAGFRKMLFPMIRRIIPGTIATELVGTQALPGPTGQVFTMRYRYAEAVTGNAAANPFGGPNNIAINDEAFGNLVPLRAFYSGDVGTAQPAGASGIDYVDTGSDGVPVIPAATGQGQPWPSSINAGNTSLFGPYTDPYVAALGPHPGSLFGGSGSFIEATGGRKMMLDVVSQTVEAKTRKLQASWTIEAMQDMQNQHNMDMETEMTQALSSEIIQEIDYEVLSDLVQLAGTVATFDGRGAGVYGGGGAGNYAPAYIGDRLANIGVIINRVANEIARKTRRGAGNWIVVSPQMVSVLQSASRSVFAPAVEGSFKGPNNTMLVGTLNGTIKVYSYLWNTAGVDFSVPPGPGVGTYPSLDLGIPQATNNDIVLVGYKGGNGESDCGYFYCPYIPLMSSGVIVNPVTFTPVISLMTRYGKCVFTRTETSLGNTPDYYGKITVQQLDLT